jgi:transposase InsO family protein
MFLFSWVVSCFRSVRSSSLPASTGVPDTQEVRLSPQDFPSAAERSRHKVQRPHLKQRNARPPAHKAYVASAAVDQFQVPTFDSIFLPTCLAIVLSYFDFGLLLVCAPLVVWLLALLCCRYVRMAYLADCKIAAFVANLVTAGEQLVVDSGCTTPMFNTLKYFLPESLREHRAEVSVANGASVWSTHIGTVVFPVRMIDGSTVVRKFENVLFVPTFVHNLVSVGYLGKLGYDTTFAANGGTVKVTDAHGSVFLSGKRSRDLFMVDVPPPGPQSSNIAQNHTGGLSEADLCHRRFGHCSERYVDVILGKKGGKLSFCDACVQAKMHRRPFRSAKKLNSKRSQRNLRPLDIVATDLCGPMRIKSLGGALYFAVIIDIATRFIFLITLKTKDAFVGAFASWLRRVKNFFGRVPKVLHTDGGGEFHNKQMDELLSAEGIQHTSTAPNSSAQNPVTERTNRTLQESARAAMFQAGAPSRGSSLWGEAMSYVTYLRNRTPHASLDMQAPIDLLPSLGNTTRDHVHIWGCRACVYIDKKEAGHLARRAWYGIFVGVDATKLGYRVYDPETGAVHVSRNVVLDESVYPLRDPDGADTEEKSSSSSSVPVLIMSAPSAAAAAGVSTAPLRVSSSQPSGPSLRRDRQPSGQALRNIAQGDSVHFADAVGSHDDMPDLKSSDDSDSDSCSSMPGLADDSSDDSDSSDEDSTSAPARAPLPASSRAFISNSTKHKFPRRKKKSVSGDPNTHKDVLKCAEPERAEWLASEAKELDAIEAHDVADEVDEKEAVGETVVTARWVYKTKRKIDHSVETRKARLVARGFQQQVGDYGETFAAVVQLKSFRLLVALSVVLSWRITQLDISNAFLNAELDRPVFMAHPDGYPGTPGTVLKLKRPLYGLKNAPRAFWDRLFGVLANLGFKKSQADPCVLYHDTWACLICHHCDDLAVASGCEATRAKVVAALQAEFDVKDMGPLSRYVGIEVEIVGDNVSLHQRAYLESVLERFGMSDCKWAPTPAASDVHLSKQQCPVTDEEKEDCSKLPYREAIGSVWYAANGTRPDLTAPTSAAAQFSANPGPSHWVAVKRILRYVAGSLRRGLTYTKAAAVKIVAYSDSSWADCPDTRRSRTSYVVTVAGGPVMWSSKLQKSIAMSSCEAEFYALCEAVKDIIWLRNILTELSIPFEQPVLYVDNQSAIALSNNPVNHQRSKHIALRWFYVRQAIADNLMSIKYVKSSENLADIGSKATTTGIFKYLINKLMPVFPPTFLRNGLTATIAAVKRIVFEPAAHTACLARHVRSFTTVRPATRYGPVTRLHGPSYAPGDLPPHLACFVPRHALYGSVRSSADLNFWFPLTTHMSPHLCSLVKRCNYCFAFLKWNEYKNTWTNVCVCRASSTDGQTPQCSECLSFAVWRLVVKKNGKRRGYWRISCGCNPVREHAPPVA